MFTSFGCWYGALMPMERRNANWGGVLQCWIKDRPMPCHVWNAQCESSSGFPARHACLRVFEFDLVPGAFDRWCISVIVRVQTLVVLLEEARGLWKLEQRRLGAPLISVQDGIEFAHRVEGPLPCLKCARSIAVQDGDNSSDGSL